MTVSTPPKRSTLCTFPDGTPRTKAPPSPDGKRIVFFDIDNCLYSKECGIAQLMVGKIRAYFRKLGLSDDEARDLHNHYYKEYGLAIRGLVRHHKVDPLDYDKHCDASLPLETVLKVEPELQHLLASIDREKCHVWALTNAYVFHATRVLQLLGVSQYFEGVVSCDYGAGDFSCKPESAFFNEAISHISSPPPPVSDLYFVDDSALNVRGANALGWGHCVLFDESGSEEIRLTHETPKNGNGNGNGSAGERCEEEVDAEAAVKAAEDKQANAPRISVVKTLQELRRVWPEVFKPEAAAPTTSNEAAAV
ncbi:hypothetical protein JCM3774_004246 [Rhodotorula dairenensis]